MVSLTYLRNVCRHMCVAKNRVPLATIIHKKCIHDCRPCPSIAHAVNNHAPNISSRLYRHNSTEVVLNRYIQTSSSNFAKSKDRGKDKKKSTKVQINLNELSQMINVEKFNTQLEKAVNELKHNYAKNLTIRSSLGSIEELAVSWDGKEYVLQELAQIARKPKMVVINVSAFPQVIPNILQTLTKSGMNLNPQQDGTTLFIPIPKVTKEHRENLAKNAKIMFIKCRDNIKDIQIQHIKSLKNTTDVSKDVIHSTQSQIEALADQFISQADAIYQSKHKELLGDSD